MREFTQASLHQAQADTSPVSLGQAPIIFAGTPEIAAVCLKSLLKAGADVAAVLTREDAPVGRKKRLTPSPVAQAAEEAGISVIKANQVDDEIAAALAETGAVLGVVVAYGALLPETALAALPRGWVNLHYSRLPAYRGAAPVQHAVLNGETTTAATVFQLERGMDTGPIYATCEYPLVHGTSSGVALDELTRLGASLIQVLLPELLTGRAEASGQHGRPSYAPKLSREDAYIDPAQSAENVANRINATIPEPGAWTVRGEQRLKLSVARRYFGAAPQETDSLLPGEVTLVPDDGESAATESGQRTSPGGKTKQLVAMKAGDGGLVVLSSVQPAGKQMMNAADWYRGQQGRILLGEYTEEPPEGVE